MSLKSFLCGTLVVVLVLVGVSSAQENVTPAPETSPPENAANTFAPVTTKNPGSCVGPVGAGITPAHFFDTEKMMGTWYIHTVWIGNASEVREPEGRCQDTVFERKGPYIISSTEHFINRTDGMNKTIESESRIDENQPLQSTWASYLNNERVADIVWVQTSYIDWSLSYHCQMSGGTFQSEMMVLWVRNSQRQLDPNTIEMLKTVAKGYGFLPNHILPINNAGC